MSEVPHDQRSPSANGDASRDEAGGGLSVPGGQRNRAEEWALVLASQGIRSRISSGPGGLSLYVAVAERERAAAAISAYEHENAESERLAQRHTEDLFDAAARDPSLAGLWIAIGILAIHAFTGDRADGGIWFARGSADASRILEGEWWRCFTALFLHADFSHVLANAFAGLYFIGAVCRSVGTGFGLALILAAGAGGNLLNAISHERFHDSVGASTAVFGAIGLLAGLALARRHRARVGWRRIWLPLGAALGLLAMLGTSGARVDLWAHFYGLLTGIGLGFGASHLSPSARTPRAQWAFGLGAALIMAFSWSLAVR